MRSRAISGEKFRSHEESQSITPATGVIDTAIHVSGRSIWSVATTILVTDQVQVFDLT